MKVIFLILMTWSGLVYADFTRESETGIVTDTQSGLEWQDNNVSRSVTWQEAIEMCEALSVGEKEDWRLPNINELVSLVDDGRVNPAMDEVFQQSKSNNYWSSTTLYFAPENANKSTMAWYVDFYRGVQEFQPKKSSILNYVRCVRGGV